VSDEKARLFVALELPSEVRRALIGWREEAVAGVDGVRLVRGEDLHVTLCFLGWREAGEIDSIGSACGVVADDPPAELELSEAIWLPRRRPRVLAVAMDDLHGALASLQSKLSDALASGGWFKPEARTFLAHVTVARLGRGARVGSVRLTPPPAIRLRGSRVALYRSRLSPAGARYERLAWVKLGGASKR
jgi:RNA 2',3'-cyclic 3'-phosphodiesterase